MGRVPYTEFIGSRARFQRLNDQRIFAGWLQTLANDNIIITSEETLPCEPMERYLFQVQGPSADAYFIAIGSGIPTSLTSYVHGATAKQLVDLPALLYSFKLITQVQLRDSQQKARKLIETMVATLSACGRNSEVLVADASLEGMGVIVWEELQKGDIVQIDVKSNDLEATFMCEVRHCRPEQRITGAYRVGLLFHKPERIDLVAWRRLMNPL
jgi:hypothetical protein